MKKLMLMFVLGCTTEINEVDELSVSAQMWLPARGEVETGAGFAVECPDGFIIVSGGCETSDTTMSILGNEKRDNGWGCGVRNDGEVMGWVKANATCLAE